MAENDPNSPGAGAPPPPGGVPPRPGDAAKIQPKKETVRISLPPKPSATATIKLPSIPGGPAPAAPGSPPLAPAPSKPMSPAPSAAPAPPRPPTSGAPAAPSVARPPTSTGSPAPRPPGAPGPRPPAHSPVPAARKVSGLDVGLAIAAAVIGLGAVASVLLLKQLQ